MEQLSTSEELEQYLQHWREAVLSDPQARWDEVRDLQYWQQAAHKYEAARLPIPNTIQAVRSLLQPQWSLLDTGAGTGRFSRMLADSVRVITALDYSPAMLSEFRNKGVPQNVTLRQGRFQDTDITQHDAVLSAWSLYRSSDLRIDVRRLLELSRHQTLILEDNGTSAPHLRWKRKPSPVARTNLIAALLREMASQVEIIEISEHRNENYTSEAEMLIHYRIVPEQKDIFLTYLEPYLQRKDNSLEYRYNSIITLIKATQ